MLQTLFQLALLVCTSCLYFFLGFTPGGRTGPGGRGPMPGNGGGGAAPPGGGGGAGGPPEKQRELLLEMRVAPPLPN